ncbi:hypothetical protein MMSYN1_0738 [synthetic Mycoplasma mycoides JCVI-syn1.0]|nr:hypothetical protein MMCAP2_0738 [Mycoplasma mycoides subsp. capri str. GM12]ACU79776.1 hypothetical protein MMCAP1_0738 [Mycoplasma mycoides subsp. capri str. GM12]ADH21971.1 hypothetical protein MMSYN1_0738 [synthetic Mycoplasma mycoides JCVI-syn1.0]
MAASMAGGTIPPLDITLCTVQFYLKKFKLQKKEMLQRQID